jgi:excinuclease ABC subunit A
VPNDRIIVKGAREHNLKNIDVELPRDKLVVITGLSGSGKSTLAFDTIYAEGQRRYVESLSAYARQFLGVMQKPKVDSIEGLSPSISIEQRTASKNPRSTVATVTEIYDYLRLLFARIGVPYCYKCGREISSQTEQQIVDTIMKSEPGTKVLVLAPLVTGKKGEHRELMEKARRRGFVKARVDGNTAELDEIPELEKYKKHTVELLVDKITMKEGIRSRLADSIGTALKESGGIVVISGLDGEDKIFSQTLACVQCGLSYEELTPRMFSFNSPYGACPSCSGLGTKMEIDPEQLIVNDELSIPEGAIGPWGEPSTRLLERLSLMAAEHDFNLDAPFKDIPEQVKEVILYGSRVSERRARSIRGRAHGETFEGVIPRLMRRYKTTDSDWIRTEIEKYMTVQACPACKGARLRKESLAVKVHGRNMHDVVTMSVKEARRFFSSKLRLVGREKEIAGEVIKEIRERLYFLENVGLDYLTLDRTSETLSGGEEQRVRLATQIGSRLVGVTYILDEPSIGLHQRDNRRLLDTLCRLRDIGNTVLVVEHDRQTILRADHVVDLGPGAGENGGQVVATGPPEKVKRSRKSLTGRYLSGRASIEVPSTRRERNERVLRIIGATENNLKGIDVEIPLGLLVCITGVSGSGKSTLMNDIIFRALAKRFYYSRHPVGRHEKLEGVEHIDKVVNIDQSPIGRTPRSNPATYTGVFSYVRELYANLPQSKLRGYKPGRFSFNVRGGRCEACEGDGIIRIEMHFLPDVFVTCEVCKGKRYDRETLDVEFKGESIADVLEMTVTEAMRHFEKIPKIRRKLSLLYEVGLGYIRLGQPAPTLSGGEAQRVKLAKELSKVATGNTLYILDEPTTGLHFEDVRMLLDVLDRLVSKGNTVLIIEHNLDVVKCADHIIDLGPEGGDEGGRIVAFGRPEKVAECEASYTGQFLKRELKTGRHRRVE